MLVQNFIIELVDNGHPRLRMEILDVIIWPVTDFWRSATLAHVFATEFLRMIAFRSGWNSQMAYHI